MASRHAIAVGGLARAETVSNRRVQVGAPHRGADAGPAPGSVPGKTKDGPENVPAMALHCPFCSSDAVIVERNVGRGILTCYACSSLAPAEMLAGG